MFMDLISRVPISLMHYLKGINSTGAEHERVDIFGGIDSTLYSVLDRTVRIL